MTLDRARALIGHWPEEARYLMNERWSIMHDVNGNESAVGQAVGEVKFWRAVADTRKVWAETWDLTLDQAKAVLSIKDEEIEKTWNNSQMASPQLRQARLY